MRGLGESWCFCNGGGKSERIKTTIFCTKSSAMAKLSISSSSSTSSSSASAGCGPGTGFLIHRNLLLTTHVNLPSVNAAENAEIRLQNSVPATLVPHRFFITSSVLDLTIVGLDTIDGDSNSVGHQPQYLKLYSKPTLELGNTVFLLGHAEKKELTIGEGKVVIATDNLIKLSTEGFIWSSGSAGFDSQGNLAFMICDPMKLATSPNTKSSTTTSSSSSLSWKKDLLMQFGIPMPVIFDWLNQHWEGSLDDVNKPKLPLMRLVSGGHKSEHSCASFSMRQVFKATEEIEGTPSNPASKHKELPEEGCSAELTNKEEKVPSEPNLTGHIQGIRATEIYESSKVTANPIMKESAAQIQLLDINFPPRISKALGNHTSQEIIPSSGENFENEFPEKDKKKMQTKAGINEVESSGSVGDDVHSEVQSSCSPVAASGMRDDESSEVETLYSAETAESRNYRSPREGKFQPVGRSQSCVSYNRRVLVHRTPVAQRSSLETQRSFMQPRKTFSQGAPTHKTMDYFSPTVSSIMKKQQASGSSRPRPTAIHSPSPRWNF